MKTLKKQNNPHQESINRANDCEANDVLASARRIEGEA